MSHAADITVTESHRNIGDRVQRLEDWRTLTVDPKLKQHGEKIQSYERIEAMIAGAVRFVKVAASILGGVGTIVEVTRFVITLMHLNAR